MSESQPFSKSDAFSRYLGRILSPPGGRGRLVVFGFHQVLDRIDQLRQGEPDVALFKKDVDIIAALFNVLPLPDAVARLREGTLPTRAAAITFDDGYENNYSNAASILESRNLPATFFITCGALENGIMWNDLVIESVSRAGEHYDASAIPGLDAQRLSAAPDDVKVNTIIGEIKYKPLEERIAIASALFKANVEKTAPRLMMSRDQVVDLSRRGFDIGAHTVNHPILKTLTEDQARNEIELSRDWVRNVTGIRPQSFAYPNGRPGIDFDESHSRQVKEAGFSVAVSTCRALAASDTCPFSVPRIGPWWRQGSSAIGGLAKAYIRSYLNISG